MALISVREFARRDGCSHTLVQKAIKTGHLQATDGRLDESLAGSGWRRTNRQPGNGTGNRLPDANGAADNGRKLPSAALIQDGESAEDAAKRLVDEIGAPLSQAEAERVKENYLALLRKLEFETKSGALVSLSAAETAFFNTARETRDSWGSWAPRIATEAAAELGIEARTFTEVLTRYVQQHLAELGVPEFDTGGAGQQA